MTRPQIITLELEDCSDALVEYVGRLEQALAYESDWAEQALQSRKELAEQLEHILTPITDSDLSLLICNIDEGDWNELRYRDCWAKGFEQGFREAEEYRTKAAKQ